MNGVVIQKSNGYAGSSYPNEGSLLFKQKGQADGVAPGIICLHGHGADCTQYCPIYAKLGPGYFVDQLVRFGGCRVLAIDDMGGTEWGAQPSSDRINDAITYLQGAGGARAGKVGLIGWSMGGLAALNWISKNPAKHGASWLWAPASDLTWAHAQAAWTAEIEVAYGGAASYPTASVGNNPAAAPASYRGVGPIRVAHAADDATVPQSQSTSLVAAVNDPAFTFRSIATGGHTNLFAAVDDYELLNFFQTL